MDGMLLNAVAVLVKLECDCREHPKPDWHNNHTPQQAKWQLLLNQ